MAVIAQPPVLVGHRGYPALYPENSLTGFRAALSAGALAIECDVQFSRDGEPVVIHDADLWRTAGRNERVVDFALQELTAISVHEPARLGKGAAPEFLPTLADLVALMLDYPQATIFVEIKEESFAHFSRDYCAERVVQAVESLGARAVIISFDAAVLGLARVSGGAAIGWVLRDYKVATRLQATALSPAFLISDYRTLSAGPAPLWPGSWEWFLYDIVDWPLAESLCKRGANYIETWDIGAMLKSQP